MKGEIITRLILILILSISGCKEKIDSSKNEVVRTDSISYRTNVLDNENLNIKKGKAVNEEDVVQVKNYAGTYKLKGKNDCEFMITLLGEKYTAKTVNRSVSGDIKIIMEGDETHLLFENFFGDDPKKEIKAKYDNGTIVIQNYGNATNEYIRLNECNSKYLILEKV